MVSLAFSWLPPLKSWSLRQIRGGSLEVNPVTPERLESLIQQVYNLPPKLLARAKALQNPACGPEFASQTVRAAITLAKGEDRVEMVRPDGARESIQIDTRTFVMVDRATVSREGLKSGMVCEIDYLERGTVATALRCD